MSASIAREQCSPNNYDISSLQAMDKTVLSLKTMELTKNVRKATFLAPINYLMMSKNYLELNFNFACIEKPPNCSYIPVKPF